MTIKFRFFKLLATLLSALLISIPLTVTAANTQTPKAKSEFSKHKEGYYYPQFEFQHRIGYKGQRLTTYAPAFPIEFGTRQQPNYLPYRKFHPNYFEECRWNFTAERYHCKRHSY